MILVFKVVITTTATIALLLFYFPSLWNFTLLKPCAPGNPLTAHANGDAKIGAVASESSLCSAAGIDMLKQGGNAADAVSMVNTCSHILQFGLTGHQAVATVFCVGVIGQEAPDSLGVTEPMLMDLV